jgi:hypothetical protein
VSLGGDGVFKCCGREQGTLEPKGQAFLICDGYQETLLILLSSNKTNPGKLRRDPALLWGMSGTRTQRPAGGSREGGEKEKGPLTVLERETQWLLCTRLVMSWLPGNSSPFPLLSIPLRLHEMFVTFFFS